MVFNIFHLFARIFACLEVVRPREPHPCDPEELAEVDVSFGVSSPFSSLVANSHYSGLNYMYRCVYLDVSLCIFTYLYVSFETGPKDT